MRATGNPKHPLRAVPCPTCAEDRDYDVWVRHETGEWLYTATGPTPESATADLMRELLRGETEMNEIVSVTEKQ